MTDTPPSHSAPPGDLLVGASLFLDFDGTLVAIAERPDAVVVDESLDTLMNGLIETLQGRVAIITGRSLAEIDRIIARGRLALGGSHGLELRWPDGRTRAPEAPVGLAEIVAEMHALQAEHPGLIVEEKPFGAALHYRRAPAAEVECRALAARLAERQGMTMQAGKMVFEIKAAGQDKGSALRALMEELPMRGTRPVFIGDDETDEAAFRAARDLGGAGILVGPARPTSARYRLEGVAATRDWLGQAAEALA